MVVYKFTTRNITSASFRELLPVQLGVAPTTRVVCLMGVETPTLACARSVVAWAAARLISAGISCCRRSTDDPGTCPADSADSVRMGDHMKEAAEVF